MSLETSFSTSGSTVGDQCTVSRSAAVRTRQYAASTGFFEPQISGLGPERRVRTAPVDQLGADAGDDEVPVPVGHPVDPRHETSGRQSAQVVVSLDEHRVGPETAGRDSGRGSGRPASDHQHVATAVDRRRSGRLLDRRFRMKLHDPLLISSRSPAGCREPLFRTSSHHWRP